MIKNASVESIINVSGIELKNKKETIKKEQEKKKLLLQAKLGKKKAEACKTRWKNKFNKKQLELEEKKGITDERFDEERAILLKDYEYRFFIVLFTFIRIYKFKLCSILLNLLKVQI